MRQLCLLWVAAALALVAVAVRAEHLDFRKVHLVDTANTTGGPTNFLFRGNMPINDTSFAYDELLQFMRNRSETAGVPFPTNTYLVVVSLNNVFDESPLETGFWKDGAHASLGRLIQWPLGFAGILPPNLYPKSVREKMALSTVWKTDHLPTRVDDVRQMLLTPSGNASSIVIYFHCSAGCDRTGEFAAAYMLTYGLNGKSVANVVDAYAIDVTDCGRPPNYFSTSAIEWFCYFYEYSYHKDIGDCTGFAKCKPFGSCQPTNGLTQQEEDEEDEVELPSLVSPFVHFLEYQ